MVAVRIVTVLCIWKTDDANVLVKVGGIFLTSTVLTGLETLTPSATSSYK